MSTLLCLPEELVLHILNLLSPLDVCHALNTLVAASPRLLFSLTLDSLGYRFPLVPRSDVGPFEGLRLLQEHHLNWLRPNDIQPTLYGLCPHSISFKYAGGVYVQSFGTNGLLGVNSTIRGLEFHQIPSRNLGTGLRRWRLENLELGVQDFTFDPDQDLLALLEFPNGTTHYSTACSVHLKTMSEGEAHPRAQAPILVASFAEEAGLEGEVPNWDYHFEVVGELIGILFRSRSKRHPSWVVVWNWVRGIEVTRLPTAGGWHASFVLLDQQTLLLPRSSDLHHTGKFFGNHTCGSIEVYTFDPRANASAPPRMVSSFNLPFLDRKYVRSTLRLRCTPNTRPTYQSRSRPRVYETSSEYPIVAVDVNLSQLRGSGQINEEAGTLYVSASVFLNSGLYAQETSVLHKVINIFHTCSIPEVPWRKWGNQVLWVDIGDSQANGDCLMYGYRMGALSNRVGIMSPANQIHLLDFNQHRIKTRNAIVSQMSSKSSERRSLESIFGNGESPSIAKYTETVLEVEGGVDIFDQVTLDDEHVIVVRKGGFGAGSSLIVYAF